MSQEPVERLLELLVAAEVRVLAVGIRAREASRAGNDSINGRPIEQYLPAAIERLESVLAFMRNSTLLRAKSKAYAAD
jgi:hypothetical protein